MKWILTWLGNLLGGPFARAAVDAYKAKLTSENNADTIAANLAARELDVEKRERELRAQSITEEPWYGPRKLFCYILVLFFAKIVIWDKMLGLGITDPITGDAGVWAGLIMSFYFGGVSIENVAKILRRGK